MAGPAKVENVEQLKVLRRSLFKFAEAANVALIDAESELNRTLMWVQLEQQTYWQGQIKKRTDLVARCDEAVRMKKLFVDAAGRRSSAVDEQKALDKAKRALEEAQTKFVNCRKWSRKLEKESQSYKGTVQRFATTIQAVLPVAAAKLEAGILKLEEYLSLGTPGEQVSAAIDSGSVTPTTSAIEGLPSMARAEADQPAELPVEQKQPEAVESSEPRDESRQDSN
jgi:hypothetical protein